MTQFFLPACIITVMIVHTQRHNEHVVHIINKYVDKTFEVKFVDDIRKWANHNNIELPGCSPFTPAACAWDKTFNRLIFVIAEEAHNDAITGRASNKFHSEVKLLKTERDLVAFLILHELAHVIHGWGQDKEDECDMWAFEQMKFL